MNPYYHLDPDLGLNDNAPDTVRIPNMDQLILEMSIQEDLKSSNWDLNQKELSDGL